MASIHGKKYIHDSKATNVNATWYALETVDEPIVWIAGGIDKGNDYSILKDMVRKKVKVLICLGTDNSKLIKTFKGDVESIYETKSMREAVNIAFEVGKAQESVLLSPSCASFDLFENFEDRGDQFKQAVKLL